MNGNTVGLSNSISYVFSTSPNHVRLQTVCARICVYVNYIYACEPRPTGKKNIVEKMKRKKNTGKSVNENCRNLKQNESNFFFLVKILKIKFEK